MFARLAAFLATIAAFALATPAHADTLFDNMNGMTIGADGELERFSAFVVGDDGRIVRTLAPGEKRPKNLPRVDLGGQAVLPGMVDAHLHVMGLGFGQTTLDLADTDSLEEALDAILAYRARYPDRPWILGRGWNQEKWGLGRFPTAADLDAVIGDVPVWLERVDGHAGWANSLAMERAGVTADAVDPEGGRIERIAGSRQPTGVFVDAASELVQRAVPPPRAVDRDLAFLDAQKLLHANGITAAADMGTSMEDWQTFRRAGDEGRLTMRIMSYASGVETMVLIGGPRPTPWLYDGKLRLNGVKIYLDGALGSRGAWLKEDYADDPGNRGLPLMSQSALRNAMARAALDKYQVAVHAIGTRANEEALNAIDDLAQSYDGDRRWRIEHAQIVDPVDLPRFGEHGIIASMQPVHQTSDRTMAEARMGESRLGGAYAWRSMLDAGSRLAFGSDAPVERPDPFAGIAAAISRTGADGQPFGGWRAEERVSREQALAAFTADAAHAGFGDGVFGRLVPGEYADFIVVDTDPLLAAPAQIRATRVMQTFVGGQRVYDSSSPAAP